MIALFRRLCATVGEIRAAEWLLLTIETVAVVGGILIAFELEQWAEDRREAKQVERLMDRLLTETRQALVHYDYHARETGARLDRAKANLAEFSQGRCPADFTDIEEVENLPADAPLTELIEVVGLSALPNDKLKSQLTGYHYASNVFYEEALPALQEGRIELFTNEDSRARHEADGEALQADHTFASQMFADPSILSRQYDREALCEDAAFRNRYALATQSLLQVAALRNDLLLLSLRTCRALAEELGQSCMTDWMTQSMGQARVDAIEETLANFIAIRESTVPDRDQ